MTALGHYRILAKLGEGGMGEVYRAADTKLGRDVALKVLPSAFAKDPERLERFQQEARALAALDHPGIVTVYSVEQAHSDAGDGIVHFLTMQLVDGQSIDRTVPEGGFGLERFLEIAVALADALAAAHEKGIVHRDLKLANIMEADDGSVKIVDFGIAKAAGTLDTAAATITSPRNTAVGVVMGTPAFMSPEQIEGRGAHASSDIFSLGVVLYNLATGRGPFQGDSGPALMSSILRDAPAPPSRFKTGLPRAVDNLILGCLEKNTALRPSARVVGETLRALARKHTHTRLPAFAAPRVVVPAVAIVVAAVGFFAWRATNRSREAVFVAQALPRIEALARGGDHLAAFRLAAQVESSRATRVPEELWELASARLAVTSEPAGATVTLRRFGAAGDPVSLGTTPLPQVRVPRGAFHWRIEKAGYLPADFVSGTPGAALRFELRPETAPDRDMIRIPGGEVRVWAVAGVKVAPSISIKSFLIDRREVTNREFAAFVAAGGYSREEFWKQPFVDGVRTLTFQEAMARFRDSTGRPGPATWKVGSFPDGEDDLAVGGVSWYEAAAYATFAGKQLPSVYHWYQADTAGDLQLLPGLVLSNTNHEGTGPRRAGTAGSMSAHGAIDMAGNVREWTVNGSDGSARVALGGAWSDPAYQYLFPELRSPFDRAPGNGLRCIKRLEPEASSATDAPLTALRVVNRTSATPASDAEFAIFKRFYERRPVPLAARIESTDESSAHWIKQRITFAAGYGTERMTALLYLPRNARPPYQVVVQMAGAATFYRRSSATERDIFGWGYAEYLLRGGRAVMIPIWKGSYERSDGFHPLQTEWPSFREHVIQWVAELQQSLDYLQSRSDVARDAIAYQGISNGAVWAPIFMALEPRIKTGIILLGGFLVMTSRSTPAPPEIDGFNYAPRVTAPIVMMNGRHDAIFPYETSQLPLFRLLGTPPDQKRHLVFPGGHSSFNWTNEMIKEGLDWLDRQFGPPVR
jgi:predicted esterase